MLKIADYFCFFNFYLANSIEILKFVAGLLVIVYGAKTFKDRL